MKSESWYELRYVGYSYDSDHYKSVIFEFEFEFDYEAKDFHHRILAARGINDRIELKNAPDWLQSKLHYDTGAFYPNKVTFVMCISIEKELQL